MRAVSVLVIACPCAMGLATPLAVISATNKLSETGVIFKNGEAILIKQAQLQQAICLLLIVNYLFPAAQY